MNEDAIKIKVRAAFVKVLEHENFVLNNDTSANDVEGWESITHMMIINEIEQEFNIKFKLMDLMNMNNIGDLIKAIQTTLN
ncbi:acyl carrier protein [Algibacter sp. AS12]|uniref:acyl carrier protein n=1 Tax=Algibacter sp. AS12 TaxID=3135773 RepID=UPI00398A5968